MKNNLIFATALLACTPLAFAQAPSGEVRMDTVQMADILMEAPPLADVVQAGAATADAGPQSSVQDGPQVQPPPPPPQQGHGPQGVRMHHREGGPAESGMDRGIIPPGPWWQNTETVAAIGLSADQQKKIEDLFIRNRVELISLHSILEQQQVLLEPLLNANPVDETKALAAIDQIADSRAKLEKANAKMLLSIRGVLTPDQWTKLQAQRPHGRMAGGPDGKRGPGDRHSGPPAPPTEE